MVIIFKQKNLIIAADKKSRYKYGSLILIFLLTFCYLHYFIVFITSIMANLVKDVLLLIFIELQDHPATLYSCVLTNKTWCSVAIRVLWNSISYDDTPLVHTQWSREKLYNVISHFLPNGPNEILRKNNIILPLNQFTSRISFNYMEFFTRITSIWIQDMVVLSIEEDSDYSNYKKKLLEHEIYKLIFNKCKNINHFNYITDIQLYLCPKADKFFSNLHSIEFNLELMTSVILLSLPTVCNNITNLKLNLCNEDSSNLVLFIKMQQNLQSLHLNFDNEEEKYPLLSDVIKTKAATLKHITLTPLVTSITPIFFSILTNLKSLVLNNDVGQFDRSVNWQEWVYYLSIASFPNLEYVETTYLPLIIETLIIEKSGGNIVEIDIRYSLESQNHQAENKRLIKAISKCLKIIKLTMDINSNNLNQVSSILSNCSQLEKIYFTTKVKILPNGDELLRIMNNVSPAKLREFSFEENWNFSVNGLKSFFEHLKCKERFPIKFTHYYDKIIYSWSDGHNDLIKEYKEDGVIR
jgi:hypothetical protein